MLRREAVTDQSIDISLVGAFKDTHGLAMDTSSSCILISQKSSKISLIKSLELFNSRSELYFKRLPTSLPSNFHRCVITCIKFGYGKPIQFITASSDAILLWKMSERHGNLEHATPKLISQTEDLCGTVDSISVHSQNKWIACVVGPKIIAYNLLFDSSVIFEGHTSQIRSCEFLGANSPSLDWLMSVSDDRTFKVWDVINRTCIYQSAIISSSPFCALALDPFKFCCSLGTEDGRVRVYNLTSAGSTLCEPRLLKLIDIKQLQRQSQQAKSEESASHKIVSSMASWRIKDTRSRSPTIRPNIDVVHSEAIIALHYIGNSVTTNSNLVFVAMTNEFYLFNADSYDLIFKFNFQTPLPLEDALHDNPKTYSVHTASSYRFSNAGQPNALSIMIGNRLGGDVFVLRLYFKRLDHQKPRLEFSEHISANCSLIEIVRALILRNVEGTKWVENILVDCMRTLEEARIFVRSDIELVGLDRLPNSLPGYIRDYFREMWMLKSDEVHFSTLSMVENAQAIVFPTSVLAKKTVITASKVIPVKTSKVIPAGRTGSKDLPVTFHSNVKSSGYTSVPILKMFARPKLKGPATPKPIITVGSSIRACCSYAGKFENKHFEGSIQHGSSVTSVKYHPSGNFLATSSVDRMVRYYKLPISKTKVSRDFSGHNGSVTKVEWGLNASKSYGYLLLSSCTDGITRLWSKDRAEPILEINDAKTVTKSANMYYRDRFIILSCRNLVNIYSYKLEPPDSIDPRLNYNTFALKKSYQIDGHSVTALCSLNSKNSQLVFAASSNRTLNIWDINQGVVTRRINDAHTRAIHHISLPDYLTTSTNPQLFSTAAITDSIKLWDLRQDRAVMHLQGHVNRHANITSAISPCGMYLATGSEDHHCYIYDLRVGLAQKTQKNHGDVVMAVDFNPLSPEILTGTGDGRIHLFKIHG